MGDMESRSRAVCLTSSDKPKEPPSLSLDSLEDLGRGWRGGQPLLLHFHDLELQESSQTAAVFLACGPPIRLFKTADTEQRAA